MSQPLKLINAVVSGLTVHAGEDEFFRSARLRAVGVGAATGFALEGLIRHLAVRHSDQAQGPDLASPSRTRSELRIRIWAS